MPLPDINNPAIIKFLVESYEKTERLRIKWNISNAEKLKESAQLQREEKGYFDTDVTKNIILAGMPTLTRDDIAGARNKRRIPIRDGVHIPTTVDMKKGNSIVDIGLGDPKKDPRLARPDKDTKIDPVMRPVDPKHSKIIYKGIPTHGRNVYLKTRNKMAPEDKYYFTETSSWNYGWRMCDSYFGRNAPEYGHYCSMSKGALCRSGPQPDPDHYTQLKTDGFRKCVQAGE